MKVILASLTPITEEHTKLLDSLSEPSSQLIHRISHPPEEDVSAKVFTACFICVRSTVLPVASLLSVKRSLCHLNCLETVSEVNSFQTPISSQLLSSADYCVSILHRVSHQALAPNPLCPHVLGTQPPDSMVNPLQYLPHELTVLQVPAPGEYGLSLCIWVAWGNVENKRSDFESLVYVSGLVFRLNISILPQTII